MLELNLQSMEWRHTHSPVRVKVKQILFQHTIMTFVFWDKHCFLLVDFMQLKTIINTVASSQSLQKLCRVIQNKRCSMLKEEILQLHDSARLHTAAQTWTLLDSFVWEILDKLPTAPTFYWAIFIFSVTSNIILAATTTMIMKTRK